MPRNSKKPSSDGYMGTDRTGRIIVRKGEIPTGYVREQGASIKGVTTLPDGSQVTTERWFCIPTAQAERRRR